MDGNTISFVIFLFIVKTTLSSFVSLSNRNGYTNIIVRIDNSFKLMNESCEDVIYTIRNVLGETSEQLYASLEKGPHFNDVTLIVPSSWRGMENCPISNSTTWARIQKADLRITDEHPIFGTQPYALQYGPCGHPGLSIEVPYNFLKNEENIKTKGKRLVREWAHYRYGVFDEAGLPNDEIHPAMYGVYDTVGGQQPEASECTDQTPLGEWEGNAGCPHINYTDCEFVVAVNNTGVTSSLMYRPDMSDVSKFCTEENHNKHSPTKHNFRCSSKSTASVIYSHDDFRSLNQSFTDGVPGVIWNLISDPFVGYHIIIDTGTIQDNIFRIVQESLKHFILLLPDGLNLSIGSFSKTSEIVHDDSIISDVTKQAIINDIANLKKNTSLDSSDFSDAMDKGLTKAKNGKDIILLTNITDSIIDDLENIDVKYLNYKVSLHLLCFRRETTGLSKLARFGSVHYIPESISVQNLESPRITTVNWLFNSLQFIYSHSHVYREKIFEQILPNITSNYEGQFFVDPDVTKLIVTIDLNDNFDSPIPHLGKISITNGNFTQSLFSSNQFSYYVIVDSPFSDKNWTYNILLPDDTYPINLSVNVWAEGPEDSFIRLRTWNSAINNGNLNLTLNPVALFAQLSLGRRPIRKASVSAQIFSTDQNGSSILLEELMLEDQGPADVTGGDGIYSSMLSWNNWNRTQLLNNSITTTIRFCATGINGITAVGKGTYNRAPSTGSSIRLEEEELRFQFQRLAYGPSFQLIESPIMSKRQPGQVTDLSVVYYDATNRELYFAFTLPRNNFGQQDSMFQGEWLVYNNRQTFDLAIRADGDRASSTVKANEFNTDHDVTFTIWAIDDQGNEGKRSNEIVIKSQPGSLHPLDAWALALIGVGGVVLLALSVVILICCLCPAKCSKAERKQEEVQDWIKGKSEGLKSFNSKMVKETPPSLVPTEDCGIPTFYDEDYVVGNQAFRTEPPHFNEPTFFGQADLDRMRNPDGDFSNGSHNRSKAVGSFEREEHVMVIRPHSMSLKQGTAVTGDDSDFSSNRLWTTSNDRPYQRPPTEWSSTESYSSSIRSSIHSEANANSSAPSHPGTMRTVRHLTRQDQNDSHSFAINNSHFNDQRQSTLDPTLYRDHMVGSPPAVPTRRYFSSKPFSSPFTEEGCSKKKESAV